MTTCAKNLLISGRVQGVFFRDSTRRRARDLGLSGWVRNLPDGRVSAFAQGPVPAVDQFVAWCHEGPPMARVEAVETADAEPDPRLSRFEVRY